MPTSLPLLHVAGTAAQRTVGLTLDGRVLTVAMLLFAIAAVIVWRAPIAGAVRALAHRRVRRRVVWVGATVLAFFAMLPAVVPYDHILAEAGDAHEGAHASHCHEAPGECADAPVAAGFGQLMASDSLLVVPSLILVLLIFPSLALQGVSRRPDVPVPLRLISL